MTLTKLLLAVIFVVLSSCLASSSESGPREKRFSITVADTNPEKAREIEEQSGTSRRRKVRQFAGRFNTPPLLTKSPHLPSIPGFQNIGFPKIDVNAVPGGHLSEAQAEIANVASSAVSSAQASASSSASSVSQSSASTVGGENFVERLTKPIGELEQFLAQEFDSFRTQFNKVYATAEEALFRKEIFIENKKKIMKFNDEYGVGRSPFVLKVNEYADLLTHEFNQLLNGFNRENRNKTKEVNHGSSFIPSANVALPISVDWREAGAVTSVKSQEKCGACYAFSATGALEGQIFRKTGQLRELSIQNLIDCTRTYGNSGCIGGLMDPAFEYVRDNLGIEGENTYPFEATDTQPCRYKREGYAAHDTGYVDLDEGDERGLESAVATIGPVSAAIDASQESFQFYSDGVYYDPKCESAADKMNHAVLVVGYGTEPDGKQYWLIKNSYGTGWGIGGYMKIAKYANNHCGIATYASYPLV
ncbi:cathepsin L-like isoform X2 [Agrilus planipennis]|uniref:Cathepsin L-like isoform X2 n=1 Tax=Agrilus planipennis TaxID=224129 RepID=A0A1W4X3Z6_AGRPL|nr:cathepsin L-like isoform X2 [Agrilus planipennis]